ncbi:MAG TPA: hypothetical protein VKW06_08755 [Candidatus Angelobacter sp.]|nr:hypothetical protein [Candidatus Angelobacter sp.]
MAQKRKSGFQISYVTITYRSVFLACMAVLALGLLALSLIFPVLTNRVFAAGEAGLSKLLAKVGLGDTASGAGIEPGQQQAHFTNIDGVVRVKKAGSTTWLVADYGVALERNDVIQTSPEGIAKVVFTDGTNYTVKPDSLIVIQENFVTAEQQTQVAVQVTTGTVDLATSNITPGSRSQVSVAGSTTTFAPDSAAEVQNDAHTDQRSIVIKKGSGEVRRDWQGGQEAVRLTANEKVSIPTDDAKKMAKSTEIGAPILLGPFDNQQISVAPNDAGVTFYWKEVEAVHNYHLRISKNQFFTTTSMVFDRNIATPQVVLKDLPVGTYYWEVRSVGDNGKESVESQKSKFTLVPKGNETSSIALEVGDLVQHGHVIEVRGRTEPGARVMVNGQEAVTDVDGGFHHFTSSLPTGDNIITVTAQNSKGGVSTKQQTVTIQ